jgi:hypothetical protein
VITFTPDAAPVTEGNPNHDRIGRFSSAPGGRDTAQNRSKPPEALSPGAQAAKAGRIVKVSPREFKASLEKNARAGTLSDYSLTELSQMQLFKVEGHDAGYAIKLGGELVNLYNNGGDTSKGAGAWLVIHAIEHGATHGDHFDGFLTKFYRTLGFREAKREPNWTAGGPAVIYIQWAGGNPRTARARYGAAGRLDVE